MTSLQTSAAGNSATMMTTSAVSNSSANPSTTVVSPFSGKSIIMSTRQVYILKGEIALLIASLRRAPQQRWSSQQEQKSDFPLVKQLQALKESLNVNTKVALGKIAQDANYFLVPFLDIIRSEDTSGPVTALALSAIEKFILNDLVNEANGGTCAAEAITDAVIHAHFVSTDSSSDEIVLMKILQVLHRLFVHPLGALLSNESVCELMQSCFRMCFIDRANELLRKSAETSLNDMVRLLFMRVKDFPVSIGKKTKILDPTLELAVEAREEIVVEDNKEEELQDGNEVDVTTTTTSNPDDNSIEVTASTVDHQQNESGVTTIVHTPDDNGENNNEQQENVDVHALTPTTTTVGQIPVINIEHPTPTQDNNNANNVNRPLQNPNVVEFKNKRGIRFTTASDKSLEKIEEVETGGGGANSGALSFDQDNDEPSTKQMNTPYGIPCVRELVRFLVSLINPHEKQNSETMIHLGLKLLLIAVESDMEAISMHPPLQAIFKNELVKNLIALLGYNSPSNNGSIILLTVLRILFIIFDNMRMDMKYQLEVFITRLMEIIGDGQQLPLNVNQNQQSRWIYEQKELALDYLTQLWKLPTFVTELYLNYDCDLFCSNLFEDLTKLLSKNAFPMQTGINSIHILCLEGLASILDGIEAHCTTRLNSNHHHHHHHNTTSSGGNNTSAVSTTSSILSDDSNSSVFYHDYEPGEVKLEKSEEAGHLPTHEQLMAIRHKKKLFHTGSEQFNQNAGKGISFLQANGILSTPLDPTEVAQLFRDNPLLDKKTIGDYISAKKRSEILVEFVKAFDFKGSRIDESLRVFLETFRLPGEAPLISHILENFAEVWTEANGNPFANVDAAYTLSYAVIMLNVDQHNSNVKAQCMTFEQFKKNLKGVNGGQEFDPEMLNEIYNAIKSDEIVMPAEHSGVVKENYLWKMLLRRGAANSKSKYLCPKSDEGLYDHDLFSLSWGPIVAALSFIFDKTLDTAIITKTITGFRKCATISAHYGMSDVFDNLVISLCKFTTLLSGSQDIGSNLKAQNACHTVFQLVHRHGGILREGWKNFIECLVALFKLETLPKMLTDAEDFTEPSGRISLVRSTQTVTPRPETGLFSSLYSYIALSTSDNSPGSKSNLDEEEVKKKTITLIRECHPELLLSESKFLPLDSLNELVKNLIFASPVPEPNLIRRKEYDEDSVVFVLEVLIKICIQNRDRVMVFWDPLREHLFSMIVASASCDMQYLLERSTVGLLRLALRLMRKEDICGIVLQSLKILLYLRPTSIIHLSQQISFGLHEILKTTAANIHTTDDWTIIFALLEYVGAGKVPTGPLTAVSVDVSSPSHQQHQGHLQPSGGSDSAINSSLKSTGGGLSHSQSQDPIPIPPSNEYSSGSDRGYTSDSELEMRPPASSNNNEHRLSGVSPAQSWILLTHSTPEDSSTPLSSSPSKIAKTLVQERQQINFTPDPKALMKSCETLSFLVRDAAHITPDNFTICVGAIRSFVDACTLKMIGNQKGGRTMADGNANRKMKRGKKQQHHGGERGSEQQQQQNHLPRSKSFPSHGNAYDADYESDPEADQAAASQHVSIQLLDLLHTLHTRASQIFQWWQKENMFTPQTESIWTLGWKPLLQTIATLCADSRKQTRTTAIAYLQRALLVHDLQQLSPGEWCSCFSEVLFPLMSRLLEPLNPMDPQGMEETRMRAATLLCKVFLQHLTPLMGLEAFDNLWMDILTYMEKYLNCDKKSELLTEAIPESLKNLLLVMDTAGVFHTPDGYTKLWALTWEKIDLFLPHLRAEMFTVVHPTVAQAQQQQAQQQQHYQQQNPPPPSQSPTPYNNQQPQQQNNNNSASLVRPAHPPSSCESSQVYLQHYPDQESQTVSLSPTHSQPGLHISPNIPIPFSGGGYHSEPGSKSPSPPPTAMYNNSPEYTSICFGDDEPQPLPTSDNPPPSNSATNNQAFPAESSS